MLKDTRRFTAYVSYYRANTMSHKEGRSCYSIPGSALNHTYVFLPANLTFPRQKIALQDYVIKSDIQWLLGDDKLPDGVKIQDSWFSGGR
jgi:hypothetical protein